MEKSQETKEREAYKDNLKVDPDAIRQLAVQATEKSGDCPENFKCNICLMLVYDPLECSNCDHMFCKKCINDWKAKGKNECPMCKVQMTASPLNRILRKFLDQTILSGCPAEQCDQHKTEMSYEKLLSHITKDCGALIVECPLNGCSAKFSRSLYAKHFDQQCDQVKFKCPQCEEECPKRDRDSHNCLRSMRQKIDSQQKMIEDLAKKVEMLMSGQMQQNGPSQPIPRPIPRPIAPSQPLGNQPNVQQRQRINIRNGRVIEKYPGAGQPVFCGRHNTQLVYKTETNGMYTCDACSQLFRAIAVQYNRNIDSLARYECRECDMDLCEYCVSNPSRFIKQ